MCDRSHPHNHDGTVSPQEHISNAYTVANIISWRPPATTFRSMPCSFNLSFHHFRHFVVSTSSAGSSGKL